LKETISVKRIYGLALVCLFLLPIGVAAQVRNRRVPQAPVPARATPGKAGSLSKHDGADRVAIQINNLGKFLYPLGGVAKVVQETDAQAQSGNASPELVRQNNANKQIVQNSIHGFVDGLDQLEIDFRASSALQKYYPVIKGTAQRLATAEDQAAAGQMKAAAVTLQAALDQLTQVLVAMASS
jgi:hypothetical protein